MCCDASLDRPRPLSFPQASHACVCVLFIMVAATGSVFHCILHEEEFIIAARRMLFISLYSSLTLHSKQAAGPHMISLGLHELFTVQEHVFKTHVPELDVLVRFQHVPLSQFHLHGSSASFSLAWDPAGPGPRRLPGLAATWRTNDSPALSNEGCGLYKDKYDIVEMTGDYWRFIRIRSHPKVFVLPTLDVQRPVRIPLFSVNKGQCLCSLCFPGWGGGFSQLLQCCDTPHTLPR